MSKKGKKSSSPSPIVSLAASFDQALFDDLVRDKENELRSEFAENGISNRLFKLQKRYGSQDTAFRLLAEEKVWKKIYSKQDSDESREACKLRAQHKVSMDNGHRVKDRPLSHRVAEADWDVPKASTAGASSQRGNWRYWGYN